RTPRRRAAKVAQQIPPAGKVYATPGVDVRRQLQPSASPCTSNRTETSSSRGPRFSTLWSRKLSVANRIDRPVPVRRPGQRQVIQQRYALQQPTKRRVPDELRRQAGREIDVSVATNHGLQGRRGQAGKQAIDLLVAQPLH